MRIAAPVGMPTLTQPEMYIGNVASLFAEDGSITNADTKAFLTKFVGAFDAWIGKTRA
jgi:chromate reductase